MSQLPFIALDGKAEVSNHEARQAGRELAGHPLLAARNRDDERPAVLDVVADTRSLLSTYGISLEVVRSRPGLVVLRTRSDGRVAPRVACEVMKGLLTSVTEEVCGVHASLVENTCVQRGASACVCSMVFDEHKPPQKGAPVSEPAPLFVAPEPEPTFDPMPELDHELPQWDPPLGIEAEPPEPAPRLDRTSRSIEDSRSATTGTPETSPTAAPSTGFHVQVSTPRGAPVPATAAPPLPAPAPAPAPPVAETIQPATAEPRTEASPPAAPARRRVPKGLIRRSWLLALALIAGATGGWFAGKHAATSYNAQATLVVQSGAGKTGPGSANDALALATTYSALIPKDQSIVSTVSTALGLSPSAVEHDISVSVENGTSILLLDFSATRPSQATAGADAVARAVASSAPLTPAIAAGSIAIVNLPTTAHLDGTLHKYGVILGGLLGLVVGLILVLAAERTDPRIDDAPSMATAAGCRASQVPSELSFPELARVLSDVGRAKGALAVVPLTYADTSTATELARALRPWWPSDGPSVSLCPSFAAGVVELSRGSGPTVLVSHPGTSQREVTAATERLRSIGRSPVWAILANRRFDARVSDRVG